MAVWSVKLPGAGCKWELGYVYWVFSALQHRVSLETSLEEATFRGWYGASCPSI